MCVFVCIYKRQRTHFSLTNTHLYLPTFIALVTYIIIITVKIVYSVYN